MNIIKWLWLKLTVPKVIDIKGADLIKSMKKDGKK
jgi:hypothetical protein